MAYYDPFRSAPSESFLEWPKAQRSLQELPGFKLPLDYAPSASNVYGVLNRSLFPSALDDRDIRQGYTEYVELLALDVPSMDQYS